MAVVHRALSSLALVALAACSGAGATVPPQESGPAPEATSTSPTDPVPGASSSSGGSSSGAPAPTPTVTPPPPPGDPGAVTVTEQPAPTCHDLAQRASMVSTSAMTGPAPTGAPLATAPSGLYVATELREWEVTPGGVSSDPPSKTTIYVTKTRWYYVSETAKDKDVVTTSWSLADGWLTREVVCRAAGGTGQQFEQRAWASPNGFTVMGESRAGRPLTVRYEHRD